MTTTETPTRANMAYERADKDIRHFQRLLAGDGLTAAEKRLARLRLIRAVLRRCEARDTMEGDDL